MPKEMPNKDRVKARKLKKNGQLVMAALEQGHTSRKEIAEATGLTLYDISNLFKADREVFAAYQVRKRTLLDVAADNIQAIVENPGHPQHYQASKYVLDNFKNEFDEVFESKDGNEIHVDVTGEGNDGSPVRIVFGNSASKESE